MEEQKQELTLKLTVDEVNLVLASLAEMPYKSVINTVLKIRSQGESQLKGLAGTGQQEQPVSNDTVANEY